MIRQSFLVIISKREYLLNLASFTVDLINLIEEAAELFLEVLCEVIFCWIVSRVVHLGEAVVQFLVPSHAHLLFVEDVLISEGHQQLNWDGLPEGVLHQASHTLIRPALSWLLSTLVDPYIR